MTDHTSFSEKKKAAAAENNHAEVPKEKYNKERVTRACALH